MCLGILFPPSVRNVLIILMVITALTLYFIDSDRAINARFIIINSGIFFTYLISLLYTDNIEIGLKKLETSLSLLVFPIIFGILPKAIITYLKSKLNIILNLLIIAGISLIIISFTNDLLMNGAQKDILTYISRLQRSKTIYGIDNLYRSFHVGISLLCSFILLYRYDQPLKWIYAVLLIMVSSILLIVTSSKVIVAAAFITLFAFAFIANTKKILSALMVISGILLAIAIYKPNLNDKITNLFTIKNENHVSITQHEVRDNLSNCSSMLLPEAGFFGYGIGDAKFKLVDCYRQIDSDLEDLKFNTHNQYVSIILISGFFGLLIFIIFLFYHIVRSLNYKNYSAIVFIIFFAIVMISENILERNDGVISFALLLCLFLSFNRKEHLRKKSSGVTTLDYFKEP